MDISHWQSQFEAYLADIENDHAHEVSHARRVWRNARLIMQGGELIEEERSSPLVILTACYFHDYISLPKDSPDRHKSSGFSATKCKEILEQDFPAFPADLIDKVQHAIRSHSFSANILPETIEAKIVQDADRIEALGPIGLARVFYIAGQLNQKLFDAEDPLAKHRPLNEKRYTLDHFQHKLFNLAETMQTPAGRTLALERTQYLKEFVADLVVDLATGDNTLP